jgi:cobalt/nickel transport system permease protein
MGGFHLGSHASGPVRIKASEDRHALPFASVPPLAKLLLMMLAVVGTALAPGTWWPWHLCLGVFLVALILLGRLSLRGILLRLLVLAPFVLGACLASLLQGGAGPGWRLLALRGGLCVATVSVFASVTPISSLPALLRRLKVPSLLVTTFALMHRYLTVLIDESERMRRARASRSLRPGRVHAWNLSAELIGRLFIRASERAERIYLAMCARGWK